MEQSLRQPNYVASMRLTAVLGGLSSGGESSGGGRVD